MSRVEVTQLQRPATSLKRTAPITIETDDIVARAETDCYSVLYLRTGQKLLVQESLREIERLSASNQIHRKVVKQFKREIRESKAAGMSVDQAFAAVWEEISTRVQLSDSEEAELYHELIQWTKHWLK